MVSRIVQAIVVGVVVMLGCILLGGLLVALSIPVVASIGAFLGNWSTVLGILAGLWFFFRGRSL